MAVLFDYLWTGAAADPAPAPIASTPGEGTFRRIGDGTGGVSVNNTFSTAYDQDHNATANHQSTSYFADVGGRNGGPAVCMELLSGACYFMQNGDGATARVYWTNGLGSYLEVGSAAATFNTTDGWSLRRIAATNTLQMLQAGVQFGSDIVDSALSGGEPGTTGYDDAQRWSRVVHEDDSAAAAATSFPPINRSARRARMLHF